MKKDYIDDIGAFDIEAVTALDERFKGRIKLLMDARESGRNLSFGGTVMDSDSCRFTVKPNDIVSGSDDFCYNGYNIEGYLDNYYIHNLFPHLHDLSYDEIHSIFEYFFDDGVLCERIDDEDILFSVLDVYEEDEDRNDEMGLAMVRDFLHALTLSKEGDIEGALSVGSFRDFCTDVADKLDPFFLSGDEFPLEIVARYPYLCFHGFTHATEEHFIRVAVFASREVFLYDSYKDSLPPSIRRIADAYISVFKHPGEILYESFACKGHWYVLHSVEHVSGFPGFEERGFNILFEKAVEWLDGNLKDLREKYGREDDLSVSHQDAQVAA